MPDESADIRSLLAPIESGQLLFPGSIVAEVVALTDLRPIKGAPEWIMGELDWQDWRVPIVSFAMLAGAVEKEVPGAKHRVLVIKSLAEQAGTPYIGIMISGVPRLSSVQASALTEPDPKPGHPCVFREVTFEEKRVIIPDLDELMTLVEPVMAEV